MGDWRKQQREQAARAESDTELEQSRPPIHEQHPLSEDERRLVDGSVERAMNNDYPNRWTK